MRSLFDRLIAMAIPEPNTGCWLWLGVVNANGYGVINRGDGRAMPAHRASFEAHRGPIPDGRLVMHLCDQRSCVNPAHLEAGSAADNSADMVKKGRSPRSVGRANGKSVLDARKVRAIRSARERGESIERIAARFGISRGAVFAASTRRTWRHV